MVMFATATTASLKTTNDVVIMLKNHERALHVNAGGKVTATDISLAQFFSMESVGDIFSDTFKIALYAKEVGRYLCFRRGKLVGMRNLTRDCHFIESLDHGYFLYANAYNPLWRVGFTRGLKPVGPRHWNRPQTLKRACFLFVKINAEHFDRSRFTTTTTAAPRIEASKAAAAVALSEAHKLHDSKASIIDSNRNNYKRTKSASNGKSQLLLNNSENANDAVGIGRQWRDRDVVIGRRHRKRKHHAKLAAVSSNGGSGLLQPKNLVRHHHDQGNGEGRRRQHQREERERKLRLQNQRRQQQQERDDEKTHSEPMPNATNSATPSLAATTLAATASLAPSALNIVAMLAAGRRKRGRRKKQAVSSVGNLSSNSGHHQAMDLQLVAQSPLQAQSQYDRIQLDSTKGHDHNVHQLRHHHEHNCHQKHSQLTDVPVNSNDPTTKEVIQVQQQNHKYSTNNRNSQLIRSSSSRSRSHSHSPSSRNSSSIKNDNLSHNYNLNLNANVNNSNLNNSNNDNVNAIPALPKKYLSKNNFNNEYLMQQTTKSSTDFNTKTQFSHFLHSRHAKQQNLLEQKQQYQQLEINRSNHNHTSHDLNILPLTLLSHTNSDNSNSNSNSNDNDTDDDSYTNDENSNRLLVNNSNISDNNLLQEHSVNRFKLIYLDRIRSHNLSLKLNTNNVNNIFDTQKQKQKQQMQHYNHDDDDDDDENNSPIRSTRKKEFSSASIIEAHSSDSNSNSSSSSSSIKNSSSNTYYNHSHRRYKRNFINDYITRTNNNNYDDNDIDVHVDEKNKNNVNNAKSSNSSKISNSSISNYHSSGDTNINVLKRLNDSKMNIFRINQKEYLNVLMPSTTAYRNSKLLTILDQQKLLKQQQIITTINNPNKYNYNNYNANENDYEHDGEKFKEIQNKCEKIIVQYRSVFN